MTHPKKGQLFVMKDSEGNFGVLMVDVIDYDKKVGIAKIKGSPHMLAAPPFHSTRYALRFSYFINSDNTFEFELHSYPTLQCESRMDQFEIGLLGLEF